MSWKRNVFDAAANLSRQITDLQDKFLYHTPSGVPVRFECMLTGNHGSINCPLICIFIEPCH